MVWIRSRHPGTGVVISAFAGIQTLRAILVPLGSGFRRNDNVCTGMAVLSIATRETL